MLRIFSSVGVLFIGVFFVLFWFCFERICRSTVYVPFNVEHDRQAPRRHSRSW